MSLTVAGAKAGGSLSAVQRTGSITFVRYARRNANQGDPKRRVIQRMLYPRNGPRDESPIGTYRPDAKLAMRRALQNVEVHETIERAWLLHQRHKRQERQAELQRKWDSMHRAMAELRIFDYDRYEDVNNVEDPRARSQAEQLRLKNLKGPERQYIEGRIRGLFPREMRIPTSTPSRAGWNHDWKSPILLMQEARAEEARQRAAAEKELVKKREEAEKAKALAKAALESSAHTGALGQISAEEISLESRCFSDKGDCSNPAAGELAGKIQEEK